MEIKKTEARVCGALLGLACGDALGAPAEFKSQAEVQKRWGLLADMVGGGLWAPGEWTDDTGMALCIAQAILANPNDPVEAAGQNFFGWRQNAKDVGTTISAALSAFRGDWARAAQSTPQATSGKAAGNGSLMRTLPVALTYRDEAGLLLQSARLSSMTHWDAQAEMCCAVYCLWVSLVLDGASLQDAWRRALARGRQVAVAARGTLAPDTVGPAPLPDGFWERLDAVESLRYDELQPSGYAGYVVECLEASAWCALHGESLEDALVKAVNLAGEADTIAAVAGGVAGAFWGEATIPARWLQVLHERVSLQNVAQRLVELREHLQIHATKNLPAFNSD